MVVYQISGKMLKTKETHHLWVLCDDPDAKVEFIDLVNREALGVASFSHVLESRFWWSTVVI